MKSLLGDHSRNQSWYQIDRLVIAQNGLSAYGRYKQCLRELHGRYRAIRECVFRLEELGLDLKRTRNDLLHTERQGLSSVAHRRGLLEERRMRVALVEEEARMRGLCYEFTRYYLNADALREVLGEMTMENMEKHERELILMQVRQSIAVDCLEGRIMRPGTWALLCGLPAEDRQIAMGWLEDPKVNAVEYFLSLPEPHDELKPTDTQVAMLRENTLGMIADNPELDYGTHTYRSDGLQAQERNSLRSHVLQNHSA